MPLKKMSVMVLLAQPVTLRVQFGPAHGWFQFFPK
jgi:hypothetical protein